MLAQMYKWIFFYCIENFINFLHKINWFPNYNMMEAGFRWGFSDNL